MFKEIGLDEEETAVVSTSLSNVIPLEFSCAATVTFKHVTNAPIIKMRTKNLLL
jgi:hypothetical protein